MVGAVGYKGAPPAFSAVALSALAFAIAARPAAALSAAALEAGWQATAVYPAPNVIEFEIPGTDEENRVWRVTGGVNGHSALEARFEEGLAALVEYYLREGHLDVPSGHVEVIEVEEVLE